MAYGLNSMPARAPAKTNEMTPTSPPFRLTSLLRAEERLLEAEHFVKRMGTERGEAVGYDLNAFLASARSVSFLLQKEFSKVAGFVEWWARDRLVLANDPAARFFLELPNYSQKEGRISLVGIALQPSISGRRSRWSYRFAGTAEPVPPELLNRDIVDCCCEHLAKLAKMVLRFSDQFSFHGCPSRALTPEGIKALGIDIDEAFAALGYPGSGLGTPRPGTTPDSSALLRGMSTRSISGRSGAFRGSRRALARQRRMMDSERGSPPRWWLSSSASAMGPMSDIFSRSLCCASFSVRIRTAPNRSFGLQDLRRSIETAGPQL
jgi:hypothetical protein